MFYMFGSPYQRGFFCGDESIRYPFKESTVTSSILYSVGLGLPTLVVSKNIYQKLFPDVSSLSIMSVKSDHNILRITKLRVFFIYIIKCPNKVIQLIDKIKIK